MTTTPARPVDPRSGAALPGRVRACVLAALLACLPAVATAQGWLSDEWPYRRPVTIADPGGTALTDFQVLVTLPASFDFSHARSDGADLRVTSSDGTTALHFWIEIWQPGTQTARLWVKVPSIPSGGTSVFVYYGNPDADAVADGDSTFAFFDDFEGMKGPGYYRLGPSQTIMTEDQDWETEGPHTLSVVPAPSGADWDYYGYYGLEDCTGIGMAGSDDLVEWTKFATNPLFTGGGERWPHVIRDGTTYHMIHTADFCGTSHIVRRTSTNGRTWTAPTEVVPATPGWRNQNPNLFHDPVGGRFHLYWYQGDGATVWRIMARSATTVAGLATAPDVELLSSPTTLAAPNLMFRDGTYFLITEILEDTWSVKVYGGPSPLGPFTALPGNPLLDGDCACMFQTPVGDVLYEYYCKRTNGIWTLDLVQGDLAAGRVLAGVLDPARWTASGGSWSAPMATQPHGDTGVVAQGSTHGWDILRSSYAGQDYVVEGWGRLLGGRVWGLGARMADPDNGYSLNLYDDLDDGPNLFLYEWIDGNGTELWSGAVGEVERSAWYKLGMKVSGAGIQVYFGDVLQNPTAVGTPLHFPDGPVALFEEDDTRAQFDDLRVRGCAATDPVSTVGPETTPPETPPTVVITSPARGTFYHGGQGLDLTCAAADAEDPPGPLAHAWRVESHADSGSVVVMTANTASATFTPPAAGDTAIVFYRVSVRVTDSHGLADSAAVDIRPEVDLSPAALTVEPAAPEGNEHFAVRFVLRNRGRAPARPTHWHLTACNALLAEGRTRVAALDSVEVHVTGLQLAPGIHTLRVVADTLDAVVEIDETDNAGVITLEVGGTAGADDARAAPPGQVWLSAPYPNPSMGRGATVELGLPRRARVELAVFDVSGRMVRELIAGMQSAGRHPVRWDGRGSRGQSLPTGLYLVRLDVEGTRHLRRLLLLH